MPRPRIFRDRNNPYEMYDDIEFKKRYRLEETVFHICDIIGENIKSTYYIDKQTSVCFK